MRRITRRNLMAGMGAALGGGLLGAGCATRPGPSAREEGIMDAPRPNIIFVLADDLGYGDLGCYGQEQIQTPCLDRMAAEGVRFTQAYAGSTVCAPSRCCLMTGMHTGHAHVRGNDRVPLRPEDLTVAEALKQAGYTTGLIGKWGLGEPDTTGIPNRKGFDYFYGYLNQKHAHNFYPEYLWRNEERVVLEGNLESTEHEGVSIEREQYAHDLFAQEALDFVGRHRAEPFFLYLAYTIPHANNERGRALGDGMEVPSHAPYEDRPWPDPQKGHAAMITRMDADVGLLLERLHELGIADNTLVIFSSDNGPHKEGGADPAFFQSSGPLRGYKRDLYEGGIRVPALAWWPAVIAPGRVSDHAWAFWDFLPTAAALAGAPVPDGLDGLSFAPELLGRPQRAHERMYWEFHERGSLQGIRMGDWKAVGYYGGPLELYDLANDLGEQHDVAADHPKVVAEMERYRKRARTESEHWPLRALQR